jgi:hypothetical protein
MVRRPSAWDRGCMTTPGPLRRQTSSTTHPDSVRRLAPNCSYGEILADGISVNAEGGISRFESHLILFDPDLRRNLPWSVPDKVFYATVLVLDHDKLQWTLAIL